MHENSRPFLYFAYGPNMNLRQMRDCCPRHHVAGIAGLPGYRIGFYGYA